MKLKTIEKYVRYSIMPYPEIINRAVKGGWKIISQEIKISSLGDKYMDTDLMNTKAQEWWATGYYISDPTTSAFNIYTP